MATVVVLGAGMNGLTTAMLLAGDGHEVTVLERDPAGPPTLAWEQWQRPGVGQFRRAHYMLPRWRTEIEESLPALLDELVAAGGRRFDVLDAVPEERRGPRRAEDARFATVT